MDHRLCQTVSTALTTPQTPHHARAHTQDKQQNSLEEVIFAVDVSRPREALVRQRCLAVGTLEALGVPVSVQHLEDELVQDVLATPRALRDLCEGEAQAPGRTRH